MSSEPRAVSGLAFVGLPLLHGRTDGGEGVLVAVCDDNALSGRQPRSFDHHRQRVLSSVGTEISPQSMGGRKSRGGQSAPPFAG